MQNYLRNRYHINSESQLLVSFIKPRKAVPSLIVSSWFKNAFPKATTDTEKFKGRSTWPASTS